MAKTKRKKKQRRATAMEAVIAVAASAPSKTGVKDELLIYWDPDSPLNLAALRKAYDKGNTLDDVGITSSKAESYVNKYNSIIFRAPGKGPLVAPSEAKQWVSTKMSDIVDKVHARAQP
jgi:hypothetical protein